MTRRLDGKDKLSNETKAGATSASQFGRDRLNKKLAEQRVNDTDARGNAFQINIRNRFQNTDSGNSSRKSRKGYRPG